MKDCAGGRVNFIVILPMAGLELYFINNCACLYIQLNVHGKMCIRDRAMNERRAESEAAAVVEDTSAEESKAE